MKPTFFEQYDTDWGPRLGRRQATFRRAFEFLAAKQQAAYTIVETGCARTVENWEGDGQSTILFDRFVGAFGGRVLSVDLDPVACANARSSVSGRTTVSQGDSVAFLHRLAVERAAGGEVEVDPIGLVYLDSYDYDFANPTPSAVHHLKELCAIAPALSSGTLVMVDDAFRMVTAYRSPDGQYYAVHDSGIAGKALFVAQFFRDIGVPPLFDGYQCGWVIP